MWTLDRRGSSNDKALDMGCCADLVETFAWFGTQPTPVGLKPNTHRRRDETRVSSRRRRRCVHEFATTADGFGDAKEQRSRMGHDCRRVCSHRRHDETVAN